MPGKYDRPNGCLLNPRCPYATDKCRSEEPALADLNGGRQSKCHYPLDDAGGLDYEYAKAATPQPLLQAIDLKKHYPVKKGLFAPERLVKALDGVSFTLERGKTLAVVGESGCGKSTLGRLLTMIEIPTGGELYYQGQDLLKHDPQAQKLRRQKSRLCSRTPTVL